MIDALFSWLSFALHALGFLAALAIGVTFAFAFVPGVLEWSVERAERWLNGGPR